MSKQDDLNENVQEQLRERLAGQEVFMALLVALIETHPKPEALRRQFAFHCETLQSGWLASEMAEDFLDQANAVRRALDASFERPSRA